MRHMPNGLDVIRRLPAMAMRKHIDPRLNISRHNFKDLERNYAYYKCVKHLAASTARFWLVAIS
jgi:hypothetical protein